MNPTDVIFFRQKRILFRLRGLQHSLRHRQAARAIIENELVFLQRETEDYRLALLEFARAYCTDYAGCATQGATLDALSAAVADLIDRWHHHEPVLAALERLSLEFVRHTTAAAGCINRIAAGVAKARRPPL